MQNRSALEAAGLKRRLRGISRRAQEAVVSPIKEMALLAEEFEDVVSLGWGLPSFSTPSHIVSAVQSSLRDDDQIGKYPHIRGLPQLRDAITNKIAIRSGVDIDPKREVLVTVGAQEAIFAALLTLVDPGDEVLLPAPCFSSYIDQTLLAGGRAIYLRLRESEAWRLDPEEVASAVSCRTKALVLNYPANPTGAVFLSDDLRRIAELAQEHDFYIVVDETYRFLAYDGRAVFDLLVLPELFDRLIVCGSFSKEYAMSGWRVGYLIGEGGIVEEVLKVHDASVITVPRVSQEAALAALEGPQDCVAHFIDELEVRRNLLCSGLEDLRDVFSFQRPAGSYYVFPRVLVPGIGPKELALRLLREVRLVTIPGDAFGPADGTHLRLYFAARREEIREGCERLRYFIQRLL